jgi:hypothetical protein
MYNANMVVDILAIPPRKDPGDVCCKWRFSMRTEDNPAYVPGAGVWWCRIALCTAMPQRNWGLGSGRRRCGWPTASPPRRCRSISAGWGCSPIKPTGAGGVVRGLITAVYSRHTFVWPTYWQTLNEVIGGFEAAWEFFGGVRGRDPGQH